MKKYIIITAVLIIGISIGYMFGHSGNKRSSKVPKNANSAVAFIASHHPDYVQDTGFPSVSWT